MTSPGVFVQRAPQSPPALKPAAVLQALSGHYVAVM
jgi:hypothetical protein